MAEAGSLFLSLRLKLVEWLLPRGFAIWSWGGSYADDFDQPLIAKDPR